MPIRLSAAEFKQQFGVPMRNKIVNADKKSVHIGELASPEQNVKKHPQERPQIRLPKKREPNKTEAEWMRMVAIMPNGQQPDAVLFEPWSLNLPSGTRYTPDVVLIERADVGISVTCYEVKGAFIHNQRSIHAFKEARAAFPWMEFVFAQKRESGWTTTEN